MNLKAIFSHKLFKNSTYYLVADVSIKFIPFIVLPFVVSELGASQYANVVYAIVVMNFFHLIIGLELLRKVEIDFFRSLTSLSKSVTLVFIVSIILLFIYLLILSVIINILNITQFFNIDTSMIYLLLFISFFLVMKNMTIVILRNKEKVTYLVKFELLFYIFMNITYILLVVNFKMGWEGYIWALIVSHVLSSIIYIKVLMRYIFINKIFIRSINIKDTFKYTFPFIPNAIKVQINNSIDKIFIGFLLSNEAVGIYSVMQNLASAYKVFTNSLMKAIGPYYFKERKTKAIKELKQFKIILMIIQLTVSFAIGFILYYYLNLYFTIEYYTHYSILFILIIAHIFRGFLQVEYLEMAHVYKTQLLYKEALIVIVTNLVLTPLFILLFDDIVSAAYSALFVVILSYIFISYNLHYKNKLQRV